MDRRILLILIKVTIRPSANREKGRGLQSALFGYPLASESSYAAGYPRNSG
jgi:hypothetical protein